MFSVAVIKIIDHIVKIERYNCCNSNASNRWHLFCDGMFANNGYERCSRLMQKVHNL